MSTVRITERDGVTMVALEDGRANTLSMAMQGELAAAADRLKEGKGGIVLTGSGRFFSAGLDLSEVAATDRAGLAALLDRIDDMFAGWFAMPRPVVTAVNGHAIAGGAILALLGDCRLAARGDYKIGLTEIELGIPFPGVALEAVLYQIGPQGRDRVVLQGEIFGPEAAVSVGLAERLCDPDRLLDDAWAAAARLARAPGSAFAHTKASLRAGALSRMRESRGSHARMFLDAMDNAGVRNHIAAALAAIKARKK